MEFDRQLYFLQKKNENINKIETLQDILSYFELNNNHTNNSQNKANDNDNDTFRHIICDIFQSYFVRFVPFTVWKIFIDDNIYTNINQINIFINEYAFFPIKKVIFDESLTDFQQERNIRKIIYEYESYPDVYNLSLIQKLFQLSLDDWKHLVSFFPTYNKRTSASFENLVYLYEKPANILLLDTKNFLSKYKFFSFFTIFDSINNININSATILKFFNDKSHFENDTFWFNNETPINLTYTLNNEVFPYTETEYNTHKNCLNTDKYSYIFKIPFSIFSQTEKQFVFEHFISILPFSFQNNLRNILKLSHLPDDTFGNVINAFHNIVARIHPSFFGNLHKTYILNIEKNIFIPRYIFLLSHKNAFPELNLFSSSNKLLFENEWLNSSSIFKYEFIDSLTKKITFKIRKQINNENINIDSIKFLEQNKSKISEKDLFKEEISRQKELLYIKQTMDNFFFK